MGAEFQAETGKEFWRQRATMVQRDMNVLSTPNCPVKTVRRVKFLLCIFHHSERLVTNKVYFKNEGENGRVHTRTCLLSLSGGRYFTSVLWGRGRSMGNLISSLKGLTFYPDVSFFFTGIA